MWLVVHILAVLLTLLRILSRSDMQPVKRLSWFMVVMVLPVFGVILYFLIGEIYLGSGANKLAAKLNRLIAAKNKTLEDEIGKFEEEIEVQYQPAFSYATAINGFKTTYGNKAQLMKDAQSAREKLIEDINNAKHDINIMYYIWVDDETGRNVSNALIAAAKRGIICRVMVDNLGSRVMLKTDLWQKMTDAGVHTSIALPYKNFLHVLLKSRLDLRNHRKITTIDGKITHCGSQNCADFYYGPKPKFAPWVDIVLRFEGPVAVQNQMLFAGDWMMNEEADLDDFITAPKSYKNGFPAQVWGDGPTLRQAITPELFCTLFAQARETLYISTPYFVPDEPVLKSLCAAAFRGVEVILICPARNDSWIVGAASRSYYHELLKAGVRIYEFSGGLLHSKTLTLDGMVTLIGSTNMDLRSFDLNYENNILLQDDKMTKQVHQRQLDYIESSHEITLEAVEAWSLPKRIWQNSVATVSPVL